MDDIKSKYVYTFAAYYCFIACGLCFSIFNPTIIDLSELYNTTLSDASLAFPIRSSGYVIGSLTAGIVFTFINRQLALIVLLLLKSATIALVPLWADVYQFYANAVFNGFFTAGIDTGINVWVNEIWGATGGPFMQALHFAFGIGSTLGPILSEPFLSSKNETNISINLISDQLSDNTTDDHNYHNRLIIPYSISALTAVISAVIYLILFIINRYKSSESHNVHNPNPQDPDTNENDNRDESSNLISRDHVTSDKRIECPNCSTIWMVIISALLLFVYNGMEASYFQFSAAFITKTDLKLSKSKAAFMASALTGSFTITRALSILIAIKLSPQLMLYIDCAVIAIGNCILLVYANSNETMLWIGNIILGAGFASFFPSFYPFIESSLRITNIFGSIFTFSSGLSGVVCRLILSQFIDHKPMVIVYLNIMCTFLTIVTLIILHITIKTRAKLLANSLSDNQRVNNNEIIINDDVNILNE